ncbi:hypothetical protein ACH4TE_02340 [Streptomyces sioyaensis]|uniref:hypothetical protein n=1 Tax=Streptomyces sioyaensis TaxID=67364 RepID=UPI0037B23909
MAEQPGLRSPGAADPRNWPYGQCAAARHSAPPRRQGTPLDRADGGLTHLPHLRLAGLLPAGELPGAGVAGRPGLGRGAGGGGAAGTSAAGRLG